MSLLTLADHMLTLRHFRAAGGRPYEPLADRHPFSYLYSPYSSYNGSLSMVSPRSELEVEVMYVVTARRGESGGVSVFMMLRALPSGLRVIAAPSW